MVAAGPNGSGVGRCGGSALIVAIWVISLLAILIGSFAFEAHMEARITSYYRKRAKAEGLARSGPEIVRMLMAKRSELKEGEDPDPDDRWYDTAKQLQKGAVRGLAIEIGEGTLTLDIVPEPARRNINVLVPGTGDNTKAPVERMEEEWARIFTVAGVPEDEWQALVDAFMDWTDNEKPPTVRQYGAETEDYYSTLKPPYQAKNGLLDTVEELLLVKGFTRTILFGGVVGTNDDGTAIMVTGIEDLFTTYGNTAGKVDVNTASERVLSTLPGLDEDELLVTQIIAEREGWTDDAGKQESKPFKSVEDLFTRVSDMDPALRNYVTTDPATLCRVTIVGEVGGVRRKVSCIAEFLGTGKLMKMKIRRWMEED
jgi:general secretion pathway protein K